MSEENREVKFVNNLKEQVKKISDIVKEKIENNKLINMVKKGKK